MAGALDDHVEVADRAVLCRRGRQTEPLGDRETRGIARRAPHVDVASRGTRHLRREQADRPGADNEDGVSWFDAFGVQERLAAAGQGLRHCRDAPVEPVRDAVQVPAGTWTRGAKPPST